MAPENPSVVMQFVDHHIFEIFEQFDPFGMVRENATVEHVRVGKDDMPACSYGFAGILRSIPIIGKNADFFRQEFDGLIQFRSLIL